MEKSESFQISLHALDRFKERWEILKGKPLEESDVLPKLQGLILKSKPEPENLALLKRKEGYYGGGEHRYMISGPWRLVWYDNRLMTVELRHLGVFSKPKLYPGEVKASFFLRVTEGDDSTLIEKAVFKDFVSGASVLVCSSKPEVNAIIRFLRLVGMDIKYGRTGTIIKKQAVISVILPKELRQFEIIALEERRTGLSMPNKGRPYEIVGITDEACREILNFLADQEWLNHIQLVQKAVLSEQRKRAQVRQQRREEQERNRIKKVEARLQRKKQHDINLEKKEEKNRIKKWMADNKIPRTRVVHY